MKRKPGTRDEGRGAAARDGPAPPEPRILLAWYDRHRRALPWRALPGQLADPYRVWLSEIMLQQTTVAAVIPYFETFVARWPTLGDLAAAPAEEIMRLWAGLGYYRRARMLVACARTLTDTHGARFPETEAELLKLPGFGPYTAAAVAAIAFGHSANVVDGNVERVIARIFAIETPLPKGKSVLRTAAATLVPQTRGGDYAQALMDLGATICTPRQPKCLACPWRDACRARALGIQNELPRRDAKKPRPVRRAIAYIYYDERGHIWVRRRADSGLLGGMTEVPTSAWTEGAHLGEADLAAQAPHRADWRLLPGIVRHVFTHFEFEIAVAVAHHKAGRAPDGLWADPAALDQHALPSVMRKIIRHALQAWDNELKDAV